MYLKKFHVFDKKMLTKEKEKTVSIGKVCV